jgi:small-conductance mechanosensitive channel
VARVRAALERVAKAVDEIDPEYPPMVLLHEFGPSALVYEVSVWTHDPWKHRKVRSRMREAILTELREERVRIAFPQMDVHFDEGVNQAFARFGKAA